MDAKQRRRRYRQARRQGALYQTLAQDIADGLISMEDAVEYLAKLSKGRKLWIEDGHPVIWLPPDAKLLPEVEVFKDPNEVHSGRY